LTVLLLQLAMTMTNRYTKSHVHFLFFRLFQESSVYGYAQHFINTLFIFSELLLDSCLKPRLEDDTSWVSATAYSTYLQLPSISGGSLFNLQPENMPWSGVKGCTIHGVCGDFHISHIPKCTVKKGWLYQGIVTELTCIPDKNVKQILMGTSLTRPRCREVYRWFKVNTDFTFSWRYRHSTCCMAGGHVPCFCALQLV
jgi:hypothetical protein